MTDRTRTFAPDAAPVRPVSQPNDRAEREADRAAEAVVQGRSVSRGALTRPALGDRSPVHRQDGGGKPKSDDEKKMEAAKKVGEAALELPAVKVLKKKVLADPLVKKVTDAVTSPIGLTAAGVAAAGTVTGLALAGKELPMQSPAIPLDKVIGPGWSAQVTVTGPLNNPTYAGVALSYKEQGPKDADKPDSRAQFRADTARMAAELHDFRSSLKYPPGSKEAEERRMMDQAINAVATRQFGGITIPGVSTPVNLLLPIDRPGPTRKKDEAVQRAPESTTDSGVSEAAVDRALANGGRPLDESTRRTMERRFGHDFSAVRIHDDAIAASTASSIDAAAFTVGTDIAFGANRFSTASAEGAHLLAHELAHVVQTSGHQPAEAPRAPVVHRSPLAVWLGLSEGHWEESELRRFLDRITSRREIERRYDADNKARAIVRLWRASTAGWNLQPDEKVMLIREMLDGPTLNADERAILDLLKYSDASDLRAILGGANGVTYREMCHDVNGAERDELEQWANARFRGGHQALMANRVEVIGPARPASAPTFGFNAATLDALFDSDRTREQLIEIIDLYSDQDRARALRHLSQVRRPDQIRAMERLAEMRDRASDQAERDRITSVARRRHAEKLKTERVLLHYMRGEVPATEAALRSGTSASDPAQATAIREALAPPVARTARGAREPFVPTLPGESENYQQKLAGWLPRKVNAEYDRMVEGRGRAEHRDPTRTRPLTDFEAIGRVARAETLQVFGAFFPRPPDEIRADRRGFRGNIHDQFTDAEREHRRIGRRGRRTEARDLILYFMRSSSWVGRVNRRHNAAPSFDDRTRPQNDEARDQLRVAMQFLSTPANIRRLNEIERNYPGSQLDGHIYIQRFRGEDPQADRLLLWDAFQILIHEYLHLLTHRDYRRYAETLRDPEEHTLIEGVCSLLTEIVWENIEPRLNAIRPDVEGTTYASLPAIDVPHPSRRRYAAFTQALQLVDIVGVDNLYAAYFLGLVDRIGGPTRSRP